MVLLTTPSESSWLTPQNEWGKIVEGVDMGDGAGIFKENSFETYGNNKGFTIVVTKDSINSNDKLIEVLQAHLYRDLDGVDVQFFEDNQGLEWFAIIPGIDVPGDVIFGYRDCRVGDYGYCAISFGAFFVPGVSAKVAKETLSQSAKLYGNYFNPLKNALGKGNDEAFYKFSKYSKDLNLDDKFAQIIKKYPTEVGADVIKHTGSVSETTFKKVFKTEADFENFVKGIDKIKKINPKFDSRNVVVANENPIDTKELYKLTFIKNLGDVNEKVIAKGNTEFTTKFDDLVEKTLDIDEGKGAQFEVDSFQHFDFNKIDDISISYFDDSGKKLGEIDKIVDGSIVENKFKNFNSKSNRDEITKEIKNQLPKYVKYANDNLPKDKPIIYQFKTEWILKDDSSIMNAFRNNKGDRKIIIQFVDFDNKILKDRGVILN